MPVLSVTLKCLCWLRNVDFFIYKLSEIFWGDTLSACKKVFPPTFRTNLCTGTCGHIVLESEHKLAQYISQRQVFLYSWFLDLSHFPVPLGVVKRGGWAFYLKIWRGRLLFLQHYKMMAYWQVILTFPNIIPNRTDYVYTFRKLEYLRLNT